MNFHEGYEFISLILLVCLIYETTQRISTRFGAVWSTLKV